MFNLGAYGKFFAIFSLAEKEVAAIAGDPALKGTAVSNVLSKIGAIGGEIEVMEPEIEAAVELCLALFQHAAPALPKP